MSRVPANIRLAARQRKIHPPARRSHLASLFDLGHSARFGVGLMKPPASSLQARHSAWGRGPTGNCKGFFGIALILFLLLLVPSATPETTIVGADDGQPASGTAGMPDLDDYAYVYGGRGVLGTTFGSAGGKGGDATATVTNGTRLGLASALGGYGADGVNGTAPADGSPTGGAGGAGGSATAHISGTPYATARAIGGAGGLGGIGTQDGISAIGGDATAIAQGVNSAGLAFANAIAEGGDSGILGRGDPSRAAVADFPPNGAAAHSNASATSIGDGHDVSVTSLAIGGSAAGIGATGRSDGFVPPPSNTATGGAATAIATGFANDRAAVNVSAAARGGAGGAATGSAGGGGIASLGAVSGTSSGGNVTVQGLIEGGAGGGSSSGGTSGPGMVAVLSNAVDGGTTGSGVLTLIQTAEGGTGGFTFDGVSAAGGNAQSDLTKSVSTALALEITATGGYGGDKDHAPGNDIGAAGIGGSATVFANGSTSTAQDVSIIAASTGGRGGTSRLRSIGTIGGVPGGAGGAASLTPGSVVGSSAGGNVTITGTLVAGSGGSGLGGGDGPNASASNALDGVTSGAITLTQRVTAGSGGDATFGIAGVGGSAVSDLSKSVTTSSDLNLATVAQGGAAGTISGALAKPKDGGAAEATGTGVNQGTGNVNVDVTATGGAGTADLTVSPRGTDGGRGGQADATASGTATTGSANVSARATAGRAQQTTALLRRAAHAVAAASGGAGGSCDAAADASASVGLVFSASAAARYVGAILSTSVADCRARIGSPAPEASLANGTESASFATGGPSISEALAALAGHPKVSAGFNIGAGGDAIGLGLIGFTGAPNAIGNVHSTVTHFSVDLGQIAVGQNLRVGFLDAAFGGKGFGVSVMIHASSSSDTVTRPNVERNFSDVAAATAFFHDNLVDLGPVTNGVGAIELTITVTHASLTADDSFRTNFIVGNVAGAVSTPASSANGLWHALVGDPINTGNGELFGTESEDLNLGGPMPLRFTRYYASELGTDSGLTSALGANRLHNFEARLTVNGASAEVVTNQGRTISFTKANDAWSLTGAQDIPYQLVASGADLILADPITHQMWTFDASGKPSKIEDGRGNTHTLTYAGGLLTGIADGLGRSLTLAYDGTGHLITVAGGTRQVVFGYSGNNLTTATNTQGSSTTYLYDSNGRLTSTTKPLQNTPLVQTYSGSKVSTQTELGTNTTRLAYNATATTVTDPLANSIVDTYTAGGSLASHTDEAGKSILLSSDSTGRRTSVTDRLGGTTTFAFHALSGQPAVITNADGTTTSFSYRARVQAGFTFYDLTKITYPDKSEETFDYDVSGNLLSRLDQAGKKSQFTYDAHGQVLTAINPEGGIVTYTYNPDGTLASSKDSDTAATTYAYDAEKRLTTLTHPDNSIASAEYDSENRVISFTDELGKTYTFTYDTNGNLTVIKDPDTKTVHFTYDGLDRLLQVIDPLGSANSRTFDARDLPATFTDGNGAAITETHDPRRRLIGITDPAGKNWGAGYDDEGRLLSVTNPLGQTSRQIRNALGRVSTVADALSHTTQMARDAMQRITRVEDPLYRVTSFKYDARGQLTGVNRAGILEATYTRNDLGKVTRITDPNGKFWTLDYTPMGRLKSEKDPLGNVTTVSYDSRGRPAKIGYPEGSTATLSYDAADNLLEQQFTDGTDLQFGYDNFGRPTSAAGVTFDRDAVGRIVNSRQNSIDFNATYDPAGRLVTVSYNNGAVTITYAYDSRDRLTNVSDNLSGGSVAFTYDDAGRIATTVRSNQVNATYTHDAAGRLTRIRDGSIIDLEYTLNAAGEIAKIAVAALPLAPGVIEAKASRKFNSAAEIASPGYTYDTRGRLTASPGHAFAWDGASRLKRIDQVTLTYNGRGDLLTRTAAGTTTRYFYNYAIGRPPIVAEKDEAGPFSRYYVWTPGGRLLYSIDAATNAPSFYHFDRVGSTLAVSDVRGVTTDTYAYSPFGQPLGRTGSSTQPFTYVGAFGVRVEGGLYHMRARYYDPVSARFLSRDSQGPVLSDPGSLDPYAYANQNPSRYVDPTGADGEDDDPFYDSFLTPFYDPRLIPFYGPETGYGAVPRIFSTLGGFDPVPPKAPTPEEIEARAAEQLIADLFGDIRYATPRYFRGFPGFQLEFGGPANPSPAVADPAPPVSGPKVAPSSGAASPNFVLPLRDGKASWFVQDVLKQLLAPPK